MKAITKLSILSLMMFSYSSLAQGHNKFNNSEYSKLATTSITQQQTISQNKNDIVKINPYTFKVEDMNIALTKDDLERAKSFNLNNQEYARYKYLMTYTARGVYSKNLDPVVTLGIEAKTKYERIKYAKLFNEQLIKRQEKEFKFAGAVDKIQNEIYPNNPGVVKAKKVFSQRRTIFLNAKQCLTKTGCVDAMKNIIKKHKANDRTDLFFTHSQDFDVQKLLSKLNINKTFFNETIKVHKENGELNKFPREQLPFMLLDNNGEKSIVEFK